MVNCASYRWGTKNRGQERRRRRVKETTPRSLPSLHRSRVLFFSVSYRPEHSGIGPYSAAVAERLAREGADVSVVAGFPHYPSWRIHASDRWRMKREDTIGGVPVTRLRQVVPRRHTGTSRALYEISFFAHGLITRLTWQETDVVVAVTPSFSGALLAYLTARRQKLPFGPDRPRPSDSRGATKRPEGRQTAGNATWKAGGSRAAQCASGRTSPRFLPSPLSGYGSQC